MSLLASEIEPVDVDRALTAVNCLFDDCVGLSTARGMCAPHYHRMRYAGRLDEFPIKRKAAQAPRPRPRDPELGNLRPLRDAEQVNTSVVRAHIRELELAGVSVDALPSLAFVSARDVRSVLEAEHVGRHVALRIMRVRSDYTDLNNDTHVTAIGTKRRLQALVAHGWSLGEIAGWLGQHQSTLSVILHPATLSVTARTHRRIAEMFAKNEVRLPAVKSHRALARAARERWVGSLAWDDVDRDAQPPSTDAPSAASFDPIAVELAMSGEHLKLRGSDRREIVARAHALRWSDQKISEVTGIIDRTVFRIRQELGLESFELWEQVRRSGTTY